MAGKALSPSYVPFLVHRLPVPRPASDPDTSPEVSVCFNEEWLPHVLACLKALVDPAAWQATTQAQLDEAMKRSMLLMDQFANAGPCVEPPGAGCFIADFLQLDYDFAAEATPGCTATWTLGTGWVSCNNTGGNEELAISRLFSPAATFINSFTLAWHDSATVSTQLVTVTFLLNGSVVSTSSQTFIGPGNHAYTASPNAQADEVVIDILRTAGTAGTIEAQSLELCYVGTFPLSTALAFFEHVFDFSIDAQGWSAQGGLGSYSGGAWHEIYNVAGGSCYRTLSIEIPASGVRIMRLETDFSFTFGAHTFNSGDTDGWYDATPYVALATNDYRTAPPEPYVWTGNHLVANNLLFQVIPGINQGPGCVDPGGSVAVTRIVVSGIGPDPF